MKSINKYHRLSKKCFNEAKNFIRTGNYLQASEKLWAAAAQIVKAYAQKNKYKHDGHRQLFKIVDRLEKRTSDKELSKLFRLANQLHINFYENWLTNHQVEKSVEEVKEFINKIEKLL